MRLGVGLDLWPRDDGVVLRGRGEGLLGLFVVEHADLVLNVDLRQGLLRRRGGGAHGLAGCLSRRLATLRAVVRRQPSMHQPRWLVEA